MSAIWPFWPAVLYAGLGCTPAAPTGGSTVFFASGADLQSINPLVTVHPLAKQVQEHVLFLTLAVYDSAFHPTPRLASWTWSPDRTRLRFHLRHDVHWHDGVPTTAADVSWTIEMARAPEVAYPRARDLSGLSQVETPDSFTVVLRFVRPQPIFPDVLTDLAILPAHRFAGVKPSAIRNAPFNQQPVGNGPFAFVEHRPNQRWVFRRSDSFPAELGRPAIDRLVIVVVDEPSTKLAALTSGELDFAGINPAHAEFVRRDPRLLVIDYPILFSNALIWNLRREPFRDRRVREALDCAIDRELLVRALAYGFAAVAHGPVAPDHPWYQNVPAPTCTAAESRTLLDQAGWVAGSDGVRAKSGRRLAFDLLTVGSGDNALEQMLQAAFRAVGAAVQIRQLELATFLAVAQGPERDFDALVTGIPGDLSLGYLAALYESKPFGPLAYAGYENPAFDRAVADARAASTEAELIKAWQQAQRVLAADLPTSWLYHSRGVQGVNRRVQGVKLDLRLELAGVAQWSVSSAARRH